MNANPGSSLGLATAWPELGGLRSWTRGTQTLLLLLVALWPLLLLPDWPSNPISPQILFSLKFFFHLNPLFIKILFSFPSSFPSNPLSPQSFILLKSSFPLNLLFPQISSLQSSFPSYPLFPQLLFPHKSYFPSNPLSTQSLFSLKSSFPSKEFTLQTLFPHKSSFLSINFSQQNLFINTFFLLHTTLYFYTSHPLNPAPLLSARFSYDTTSLPPSPCPRPFLTHTYSPNPFLPNAPQHPLPPQPSGLFCWSLSLHGDFNSSGRGAAVKVNGDRTVCQPEIRINWAAWVRGGANSKPSRAGRVARPKPNQIYCTVWASIAVADTFPLPKTLKNIFLFCRSA